MLSFALISYLISLRTYLQPSTISCLLGVVQSNENKNRTKKNLCCRNCLRKFIFWNIKAHSHYKSPVQIGGETWPSSLVEQLRSSGVNDKPSGFIASNQTDWLHHPVWLNGGKCQRKADRLRRFWFFLAAIFVIHYPLPPSQSQDPTFYKYLAQYAF